MMPLEQSEFFDVVLHALGGYGREATQRELEAWWGHLKHYGLRDVERALRAHEADADEGKRAPRPVDVKRRLSTNSASRQCAARNAAGQCAYVGLFSDGTTGDRLWFCPWHRQERAGPDASRIIEKSTEIAFADAYARRVDRIHADAARAPAVVDTAHAIALRHGNRPWRPRDDYALAEARP
jgi:hypothetical protein